MSVDLILTLHTRENETFSSHPLPISKEQSDMAILSSSNSQELVRVDTTLKSDSRFRANQRLFGHESKYRTTEVNTSQIVRTWRARTHFDQFLGV